MSSVPEFLGIGDSSSSDASSSGKDSPVERLDRLGPAKESTTLPVSDEGVSGPETGRAPSSTRGDGDPHGLGSLLSGEEGGS